MHILATTSATLDDLAEPVDLGQTPGAMVVLSFTDSDLGALAAAFGVEAAMLPSLRLANLRDLRHPMSVDLWVDRVASGARVIVVRLLGGLDWWRYGVDRLSGIAREKGIALAVLPGEDRDDPRLAEASTLPEAELTALLGYFRAGGPSNMRALLRRLAGHAGVELEAREPEPVPMAGLYEWAGSSTAAQADARLFRISFKTSSVELAPARGVEGQAALVVPVIFYRSMWLAGDTAPVDALCAALAARGLAPLPVFVASLKEATSAAYLREVLSERRPSVIVTMTAFAAAEPGEASVLDVSGAPVLQAVVATTRREAWREGARGLTGADLAMHVVLPELDGRLLAGALSFKAAAAQEAVPGFSALVNCVEPDRVAQVAERVAALMRLRCLSPQERRIGLLMPEYAGAPGRTGWAVGLDVPASVLAALDDLSAAGYRIDHVPENERQLLDNLSAEAASLSSPTVPASLPLTDYRHRFSALPEAARTALVDAWGEPEEDPDVVEGAFRFRARCFGHVTVAIAPDRGTRAERRVQYHDPSLPPRHGLLAFGWWLQDHLDGLVHMGAHGTLEWLPGKQAALTAECWPEIVLGKLPVVYPFIVSNPGEAAQAKRRLAAVTLGHLPPETAEGELAGEAAELERLVEEYAQAEGLDPRRRERLACLIVDEARRTGIAREAGLEPTGEEPGEALRQIDAFLCDLKDLRLKDGFHVYGRGACGVSERDGLLAGLAGQRVSPGPAGAPGRGRTDVVPTGRNLYAADPRALPTPTAMDLGRLAAEEVLRAYAQLHGDWPRSLVLDLWGSATLRTGGEEIAQGLALIGARPIWDMATGRVTGVEVLPCAVLGRPRVDVTFRISGLFRDLFPAQIALLDAALRAVARREESVDENPLRAAGEGAARIFGTAPGAYGAGLDALAAGDIDRAAMGDAYLASASHAYGGREGEAHALPQAFTERVAAADLLLHGADDPGRDLLEGDADLAFIGGFATAAERLGRLPDLVILDTSQPEKPRARPLEQALARIVRGRVHPRYIAGLMRHGPRGAAEMAETVDRLVGFAETTRSVPGHLVELVHGAYVADEAVRAFLAEASPEAARFIAGRLEGARRRGLWQPRRNDAEWHEAALLQAAGGGG